MTRIAFVAQDDLSTLIFASWYARYFESRPQIDFCTIASVTPRYREEVARLRSRHIVVDGHRFVHPLKDARYFLRLLRIFRRERFDVVVTFGTKPNVYAALAARIAGVPRIAIAVRGLGRAFAPSAGMATAALRHGLRWLYGRSCAGATHIWFTNRGDLEYFVATGLAPREKTFLTANSVSLSRYSMDKIDPTALAALRLEFDLAADDFVVVMVARGIWAKGVREVVDAAALLRARRGVKFIIVAPRDEGSVDAIPASYVDDARANHNVVWLDFRKDVREVYALADVAVLPSYYKEGGYPRALLEPMALGKPVIAADTDDCRGPVEHGGNGFLVPTRDASALARAIEDLYLDPEKRRRFGARSLEIMRARFDDEIVGREVLARLGIVA